MSNGIIRRRRRLIRNSPDARIVTFQFNTPWQQQTNIEELEPLDYTTLAPAKQAAIDAALAVTETNKDAQVLAVVCSQTDSGLPTVQSEHLFELIMIPGESYSGEWDNVPKCEGDFDSQQLADLDALAPFAT